MGPRPGQLKAAWLKRCLAKWGDLPEAEYIRLSRLAFVESMEKRKAEKAAQGTQPETQP